MAFLGWLARTFQPRPLSLSFIFVSFELLLFDYECAAITIPQIIVTQMLFAFNEYCERSYPTAHLSPYLPVVFIPITCSSMYYLFNAAYSLKLSFNFTTFCISCLHRSASICNWIKFFSLITSKFLLHRWWTQCHWVNNNSTMHDSFHFVKNLVQGVCCVHQSKYQAKCSKIENDQLFL